MTLLSVPAEARVMIRSLDRLLETSAKTGFLAEGPGDEANDFVAEVTKQWLYTIEVLFKWFE